VEISPIQVKTQFRVKTQWRIAGHDQQQFIKRGDPRRQGGRLVEQSPAIDNPANAFSGEATVPPNRRPDPIDSGDSDRPELPLGILKLLKQLSIPAVRQEHILMDADNPPGLGLANSKIQAVACSATAPDEDDLVRRALTEAWRRQKVGVKKFVIRNAGDKRQREFSRNGVFVAHDAGPRMASERASGQ
jgi:hypothetical protein